MLRDVINFIELISHNINFASCFLVFLGGGYVALHSREVPRWAVTGLWYIGLAGLLNAITIFVDWTAGQTHPLSHFQIGNVTETLLNLSMAVMVGLMFFNTVWKDYQGSKKRQLDLEKANSLLKRAPSTRAPRKTLKALPVKPPVRRRKSS